MKLNLIQRSENSKGEWYLRVRLNGREHKINLETTSKRDANKLAEAKYEELARAANIDGAFDGLVDLLDRLPHEESKKKRAELRAQLNVTRLNDLPSMSELWQLWSDLH